MHFIVAFLRQVVDIYWVGFLTQNVMHFIVDFLRQVVNIYWVGFLTQNSAKEQISGNASDIF